MARKPFGTLGGINFATKGAVLAHVRSIVNGARLNAPLPTEHREFLVDLLRRHPDAEQKIGPGIWWFEVREIMWRQTLPQRCLFAKRTDGSEVDFSFHMCLRADAWDRGKAEIVEACREAVDRCVAAYKRDHFAGRDVALCEERGSPIGWAECHVDHAEPWPFRRIVAAWLDTLPAPPEVIETEMRMAFDPAVRAAFIAFHDERAVLRCVHRDVNLGVKAG